MIAALAILATFAVLMCVTAIVSDHRADRRRRAEKRRLEDLHRYHGTGAPPL